MGKTAVLINTRQEDFHKGDFTLGNSCKNQPLDLAILGAILEKNHFQVKIIDANLLRFAHRQTVKLASSFNPDLLVINTASLDRWECPLPTIKEPARLASLLKKNLPKTLLIAIGPHGTITPDWVLKKCPEVDLLIRGEPEQTLQEISQNLPLDNQIKRKILGISCREKEKICHTPPRPYLTDLDQLPLPAYHLLPMVKYGPMSDHFDGPSFSGQTHPFCIVLASRGCPGQCLFCLRKMYQDQKPCRFRNSDNLLQELTLLYHRFGTRAIYFQDLSFCANKNWVIQICQKIISQRLSFSWGCEARFDHLDQELLHWMKKAGCVFINFGLESGSEKILFLNQKNIRISVIEETVAACQKEGLAIGCFKLLGLSGETRETFVETLQFMLKNKIFIPYPFPIVKPLPYPGTILHSLAEKQFRTTITWANCYRYAGKVGTKFFQEVSMAEIQRLAYQYRLKQESRLLNKHYLKLLSRELLEKITKFLH